MKPPLPEYRVMREKLAGAPYTATAIYVGTQLVYSRLGPIDEAEVREHVRNFIQAGKPDQPAPYVTRRYGLSPRED